MVKSFNATFLLVALLAALSIAPDPANALSNMQAPVRRHNHLSDRMVKKVKRQLPPLLGNGNGTGTETGTGSGGGSSTSPKPDASGPSADPGKTSDKPNPTTEKPDLTSKATPITTEKTTPADTLKSTPASTPATTPLSTPATTALDTSAPGLTTPKRPAATTQHATITVAAAEETTAPPENKGPAPISKDALLALIITAASIAAAVAIWTIIRKWKFSPSRQFEDRLEPLDWQPGQSATGAASASGENAPARGLDRANSTGSHTSSNDHHRNMFAPDHAAPSIAPDYPSDVYAGGNAYANLQRGNSESYYRGATPQPQMNQIGAPVYTRGPYDGYDSGPAPFHPGHQDPYSGYQHPDAEYAAPAGPYRGY